MRAFSSYDGLHWNSGGLGFSMGPQPFQHFDRMPHRRIIGLIDSSPFSTPWALLLNKVNHLGWEKSLQPRSQRDHNSGENNPYAAAFSSIFVHIKYDLLTLKMKLHVWGPPSIYFYYIPFNSLWIDVSGLCQRFFLILLFVRLLWHNKKEARTFM